MNLSLPAYLALALALSIAGNAWQLHRSGVTSGAANGVVHACTETNAGERAVIERLTADKAACEAGARVDDMMRRTALESRDDALAALAIADAAARAAQAAANATPECRAWAATPSCVEPDR